MHLKIADRLVIASVLPQQDSFLTLSLADSIRKLIDFLPEEREAVKLEHTPDGKISWDTSADMNQRFDFSQAQVDLIARQLKDLDGKQKLTFQHMNIYRMFVLGRDEGA